MAMPFLSTPKKDPSLVNVNGVIVPEEQSVNSKGCWACATEMERVKQKTIPDATIIHLFIEFMIHLLFRKEREAEKSIMHSIPSPIPSPLETVSQVRSWFDKLTTNGQGHIKNQLLIRSS